PFIVFTDAVRTLNITLGSGADSFSFSAGTPAQSTLDTGPGNDAVFVSHASAPLTVTSSGGTDTVDLGDFFGSLGAITAPVTITNPPSYSTINVTGRFDTVGRNVTHSVNPSTGIATISGLAPAAISYRTPDLQALNITLGHGNDTFTFAD